MCINIPPNYFEPHYREVRYPHSNLKKHHSRYLRLLSEFFKTMFDFKFQLYCERDHIQVIIFDVFPSPVYHPSTFDPSYRFLKNDNVSSELISEYEIFNTVYSYIPDLVPYLEFEFVFYLGGVFYEQREKHRFNLRKLYYEVCSREEIYRHKQYYDNIYNINT
jgi:hypothetical protein